MPVMNSSGESSPRSTCCKRYSHSAVRSGDCNCSGSTVMRETPVWAGTRLTAFFARLRSTKPVATSFSMMAARVAGVPKPLSFRRPPVYRPFRQSPWRKAAYPRYNAWAASFALLYGGFGAIQYLPLRQLRQRGVLLFLREILFPAGIKDGFALGGELGTAALQRNCGFRIAVCIADRPEKLPRHKAQKLALAQRQDGGIRLARAGGGGEWRGGR